MRLRPALVALVLPVAAWCGTAPWSAPAGAQAAPTTTVVPLPENPTKAPSIIPMPNSGREPQVEGDPGSAAQYAVMVGIIGGLGAIGFLVARDSKKHRANRTPQPSAPTGEA